MKTYNYFYKQLFLEDGFKNKYYITIGKNQHKKLHTKIPKVI